jgi:hypothetical protein
MDACGVCGGSNETCSGCDGAPNTGRDKGCSGHGVCDGSDRCLCQPGYHGVMCQVACSSNANCSGHGECVVEYEGLSVESEVRCECKPGYTRDNSSAPGELAGCVLVISLSNALPVELLVSLGGGIPAVLGLCGLAALLGLSVLRSRQRLLRMKEHVTEFVLSYEAMNADEEDDPTAMDQDKMEVQADLCIPLAPAGFSAPPREPPAPLAVTAVQIELAKARLEAAKARGQGPKPRTDGNGSNANVVASARGRELALGPVAAGAAVARHDAGLIEEEHQGDASFVPPDALLKLTAPPVANARAQRIKAARAARVSNTVESMAKAPQDRN